MRRRMLFAALALALLLTGCGGRTPQLTCMRSLQTLL